MLNKTSRLDFRGGFVVVSGGFANGAGGFAWWHGRDGAGSYADGGEGGFADGGICCRKGGLLTETGGFAVNVCGLRRALQSSRELYSHTRRAREKSCCCEQYTQAQFVVYAHLFGVYD